MYVNFTFQNGRQNVLKLAKITDFSISESWFVNFVIQLWILMIDLTLIHWNINLVAILSIISVFMFLSLVHSCIGTFFICSTSTCFCTSHIVLSARTSSGAFAHSTSTPSKLDHRLWSYCNLWQDRYRNFICITQPSYLERVWNIWIFHKVLTPNICCGMYAKSIIMLISRTSRRWRDCIYPPGWLWKCFHLNFSAVLACRSFLFPGACTKTSHSMKQHQQKAFLQHQVDLVLWVLLVLLQWMPWKQSSCLYL